MTARWLVEEVKPHRDVNITWQPISLLKKNEPDPDSDYYAPVAFTHKLLRVMESVRVTDGNDGVFKLYWELGSRIHHDGDRDFDPVDALKTVGLDRSHASAFDDETWDAAIGSRMSVGLDLAGTDIGTPIIAMDNTEGERVAIFGPVITSAPKGELALQLWDGVVAVTTVPGFWELKRTRTERPEFGARPTPR